MEYYHTLQIIILFQHIYSSQKIKYKIILEYGFVIAKYRSHKTFPKIFLTYQSAKFLLQPGFFRNKHYIEQNKF